jgi:uncharacterized membrane protein
MGVFRLPCWRSRTRPDERMNRKLVIIVRIFSLIAVLLSVYITWTTHQSAKLAGCGEGSGCEAVLQTKWSSWFGIPVSAAGILIYGTIFVLTFLISDQRRKAWLVLVFLSFLASVSGLWFIGLQMFLIKGYCIYCTAIHLIGITITILILKSLPVQKEESKKKKKPEEPLIQKRKFFYAALLGALGVVILAFGQMRSASVSKGATNSAQGIASSYPVTTVRLMKGSLPIPVGDFPVIGFSEAKRVIAHLFDYTCPACRKLHPQLLQTFLQNQQNVALTLIPMPLDAVCNPGISETSYIHLNACTYARLGLALWRVKPEAYPTFDHMMFQSELPPSPEQARAAADQLVGHDSMEQAVNDPHIDQLLRTGVNIFYSNAMERKVLPILITPEKAVYGIPDPPELTALFAHH